MEIDAPEPRPMRVARKLARINGLHLRARRGAPILGDAPVTVSLTSYGSRLGKVGLAIESIGAGSVRPSRMVLWVSDENFTLADHPHLASLERRGLEVTPCIDYRSFKKFYPLVESGQIDRPVVTADDDIMYPRAWLETLVAGWCETPEKLVGLRGYTMDRGADGRLRPYANWPRDLPLHAREDVFLTTGSGVVFPRALLGSLAEAGTKFLSKAPTADDVWVNYVAHEAGILRRWLPNELKSLNIPGSQQSGALHSENINGGRNDGYLRELFG